MKILAAAALVLLVTSALAPPVSAQQEIDLTPVSDVSTRQALIATALQINLAPTENALPGIPAGPALVSPPAGQNPVQLAMSGDNLYARSGNDGQFSRLPVIQPAAAGAPAVYGPLKIARPDGDTANAEVLLLPGSGERRSARLIPAGFMQGSATIDGRKITFGVADANLNGVFGDFIALPADPRLTGADMLALDLNGDGKLGGHGGRSALPAFRPLGRYFYVGDDCYQLNVAPDGSKATLAKAQVETGRIVVPANAALILVSPNGMYMQAAGSDALLPVGQYQVMRVVLTATDDAGLAWSLSGTAPDGQKAVVTVKANESTTVPVGLQMQLKADANVNAARQLTAGVAVTDQFGVSYAAGAFRNGEMRPAPTLKILDAGGRVLKADTFSYG